MKSLFLQQILDSDKESRLDQREVELDLRGKQAYLKGKIL